MDRKLAKTKEYEMRWNIFTPSAEGGWALLIQVQ